MQWNGRGGGCYRAQQKCSASALLVDFKTGIMKTERKGLSSRVGLGEGWILENVLNVDVGCKH